MWDALELRKMRSGKGYFSVPDVVRALAKRGINLTPQAVRNKEHGRSPFTAVEIKALAEMYGISIVEAFEIFT